MVPITFRHSRYNVQANSIKIYGYVPIAVFENTMLFPVVENHELIMAKIFFSISQSLSDTSFGKLRVGTVINKIG